MDFITTFFDIIYDISSIIMPIFIFVLVFNSGISEHPKTIIQTVIKDWKYFLRLIVYNNLLLPIIVWAILQIVPVDPVYMNGLIVLFLTAGASTIIAFIQMSRKQMTYAVSTMILLTFMTVIFLPLLLPYLIEGAHITSGELVQSLVTSILVPLSLGMLMRLVFEPFTLKIQPYIKSAQKILMNTAIYGMMIGLIPELIEMIGSGILVTGVAIVILAFAGGYIVEMKNKNEAMQLTSGFAGGQRNGAVAFAVAINNFSDPNVLLTIAVISSLSTVIFSIMSNYIAKEQLKES